MLLLRHLCAVSVLCFVFASHALAEEKTFECRAVQNEALLVGSDQLIVSTASDKTKKYCRFDVSLPPPMSSSKPAQNWFKAIGAGADARSVFQDVITLTVAAIPKDDRRVKEVALRMVDNNGLITDCISSLIKKAPYKNQSNDGSVFCFVPPPAAELNLTVSLGEVFTSSLTLPRPR